MTDWGENISPSIQGIPKEKQKKWAEFLKKNIDETRMCPICKAISGLWKETSTDYIYICKKGHQMHVSKGVI